MLLDMIMMIIMIILFQFLTCLSHLQKKNGDD